VSWDLENLILVCLVLFLLTSFAWLKYGSASANPRKRVLETVVICFAIVVVTGFDILSEYYSPRAEIAGTVIESYTGSRRLGLSYFRVLSSSGQVVRLETVQELARSLDSYQVVRVVYSVWNSHPLEIEVISGDRHGMLLSRKEGDHVSGLETFILLAALVLTVLNVSKLRKPLTLSMSGR
jgi:hypothetical protein